MNVYGKHDGSEQFPDNYILKLYVFGAYSTSVYIDANRDIIIMTFSIVRQ